MKACAIIVPTSTMGRSSSLLLSESCRNDVMLWKRSFHEYWLYLEIVRPHGSLRSRLPSTLPKFGSLGIGPFTVAPLQVIHHGIPSDPVSLLCYLSFSQAHMIHGVKDMAGSSEHGGTKAKTWKQKSLSHKSHAVLLNSYLVIEGRIPLAWPSSFTFKKSSALSAKRFKKLQLCSSCLFMITQMHWSDLMHLSVACWESQMFKHPAKSLPMDVQLNASK